MDLRANLKSVKKEDTEKVRRDGLELKSSPLLHYDTTCVTLMFVSLSTGKDGGGQRLEEKCGGHVWNGGKEENV